ncbi:MAG: hypothetical protein AAGJ35_11465, partial [Myxococcota bacterium]
TPPQQSTTQQLHHQLEEAYLTLRQLPKEEWIALWKAETPNLQLCITWQSPFPHIHLTNNEPNDTESVDTTGLLMRRALQWLPFPSPKKLPPHSFTWLIDWLEKLAQAHALLEPQHTSNELTPQTASSPLARVWNLATQVSRLPSPEDQREKKKVSQRLQQIWARLELIRNLDLHQKKALQGIDVSSFDSQCEILEEYLKKYNKQYIQHLLDLATVNLLPSQRWLFCQKQELGVLQYISPKQDETLWLEALWPPPYLSSALSFTQPFWVMD